MRNFQLACSTPYRQLTVVEDQMVWSFRTIKYILAWLLIWQDNMVPGSPLQLFEHLGSLGPFHSSELLLIVCLLVLIVEKILKGDFTVKRSYFWGPFLFMILMLMISWARGSWWMWQVKPVFEMHEAILVPLFYFVVLNFFKDPGEWRVVLVILIFATVAKAFDGVGVYIFSTADVKSWGVLQQWRDGYLLALGIVTTILLLHYKGKTLKWLRTTMIVSLPVFAFTLIVSYRRTYFLAVLVCLIAMFVTLPKGRKLKQLSLLGGLLLLFIFFILATDPVGFMLRLFSGVFNPKEEGSAYIRLMEFPNIIQNIIHHPFFGVPVGVPWKMYYSMPLIAVFTQYGCHNTYLYWPLRLGVFGVIFFGWFLARMWKAVLLQKFILAKTEEQNFYAQVGIMTLIIYQFACFLGLLYADGAIVIVYLMVWLQLMIEAEFGVVSLKNVKFFASIKQHRLMMR